MRIACLTQCYPPAVSGASIVARQLAEGMARRGHRVMVVAPSGDGKPRVIQKENLSLVQLRSYHNPLRVRQRFMLNPGQAVFNLLKDFQPDFIHSHDLLQVGLTGVRYARRAGVPICTTLHQLPWFVSNHLPDHPQLRRSVEEALWGYGTWLLRKHNIIVAPTQTVADIVSKRTSLLIDVISNGVDLRAFRPPHSSAEKLDLRTRLNLPTNGPLILHVGQLIHAKRVNRTIEAAARAMMHTEAHLLVVGDGPQKTDLMRLCSRLGISDRTHFTGFVTVRAGLPDVYRAADVFVTASEIETQGIVLLEAAASGLPLVAVNATCIGEIVLDGINGRLTESGDTGAMSEAICEILQNPELSRSMSAWSRNQAEGHAGSKTLDLYERMYNMAAGRDAVPNIPKHGRHEQLYNWISALMRR